MKAIDVESYKDFIRLNTVSPIKETDLDKMISEKYGRHWTTLDLEPWGSTEKPKWVQNVASAKAVLERQGEVIKYEDAGELHRVAVSLPQKYAVIQWLKRKTMAKQKKQSYSPLEQPETRYLVPDDTRQDTFQHFVDKFEFLWFMK